MLRDRMPGASQPLDKRQRLTVLILSLAVGATRFYPLSLGPWDWDEILFCLAVDHYNVALHQPHPAGFPLFILLGKIARWFTATDFHALQAVNVFASVLLFPTMFAVARAFRLDFVASIGAALLVAFMPNVWFYGGTAFSDPLGMLLFLGAIGAYLSAGTNARRYMLASILLAAAVLVRPQNAVVAVFPWTLATVRLLRAKQIRTIVAGSLVLIVLVAIGYGAAANVTGEKDYFESLRGHSQYVTRADTIASAGRTPLHEVFLGQLNPFDSAKVAIALNLLALIAIVFGRRPVVVETLLTYVPFFVFTALAANPAGSSRFSLNWLAGIAILAIEGIDVLARFAMRWTPRARLAVHAAVLLVLLGRLITWAIPAFKNPRTTIAPPTAAAIWLGRNVPTTSTLFVDASMWPWVKYYAPKHRQIGVFNTAQVFSHPTAVNGWYAELSTPPKEGAIGFLRPRDRTWNIVTKRGFEAFVQPTSEMIGFGKGWYGLEDNGIHTWRWSQGRAIMHLGQSDAPRELRLNFHVPPRKDNTPVQVTFTFNGRVLESFTAKQENDVRYVVQGRVGATNVLVVDLSSTFVPSRDTGGHDDRELGMMLQGWSWRRVP